MRKMAGFEKGINLGGWFSQCPYTPEHYESFITQADLAEISSWGIDHVRIPFDYDLLETKEGVPLESGMMYLQRAVSWCRQHQLRVVLDLHKTAGFSFDTGEKESGFFYNAELQERFYQLWERVAEHFGTFPDEIAFELLNEVTDREYGEAWNTIAANCVSRIRSHAPETYILIGGCWNNSVLSVQDLPKPMDSRIVYNFHCYEPLVFTHQGGYWVRNMPADYRLSYPGIARLYWDEMDKLGLESPDLRGKTEPDAAMKDFFMQLFAPAVQTAQKQNVPLYCGEYGVIHLADDESAASWYKAIHAAFAELGIGRAAWCYKGLDFGLTDGERDRIRDTLKQCL